MRECVRVRYFFRLALVLEDPLLEVEVFFWAFDPASFFLPGREKLSLPAYQRERFYQQQQNCLYWAVKTAC